MSLSSDDTSAVATASGSEWPITPQFGREPGPSWRRVLPLVVVVAPFAVFAAAYVLVTPLGQGPDELSHLGYIHGIVSPGVLPTAATPEKQQPPLYYLMGAVLYMLTHDDRLVRLLSVVLGIAALGVSWLVVRRLLPGRPWLAALAVALMAFLPEAQYVSGVVDDDSLAWLSGTLVILLLVVVLQSERVSLRLALGAGAVVGVALVSKETVWLAALILAALVAVRCLRQGAPGRLWALALPAAAISGWWFVRNVVTFHSLLPPLAPLGSHNQYLDSLLAARDWVSLTLLSTVGLYGAGAHSVPIHLLGRLHVSSIAVGGVALLVTAFVVVEVVRAWPRWRQSTRRQAVLLGSVAVLALLQSGVNSVLLNDQPQGRYLLPVAVVAAVAAAWAAGRIITTRAAGIALGAGLGAVGVVLGLSGLLTVSSLR